MEWDFLKDIIKEIQFQRMTMNVSKQEDLTKNVAMGFLKILSFFMSNIHE